MLQTAQIAGRDVRRAQTVRQVDEHLAQLQKISDQARERIIALQLRAESDATRKKLERVNGLILEYVAAAARDRRKANPRYFRCSSGWMKRRRTGPARSINW